MQSQMAINYLFYIFYKQMLTKEVYNQHIFLMVLRQELMVDEVTL